jgi:predicted TIM-barrel fold metal-dependent hydrolase
MSQSPTSDVIDGHVHLWRNRSHEEAALPGLPDDHRWGTPAAAADHMRQAGLASLVFLNVLPTDEMIQRARRAGRRDEDALRAEMSARVQRQNDWACGVGQAQHELVPFIGIQPVLGSDIANEIVRCCAEGARGVKIQPGMNQFRPDDPVMMAGYESAQVAGLPVVTDSGSWGRPDEHGTPFGHPRNFEPVLATFPGLTLVMAHFPSAGWSDRVALAHKYKNLAFDLSGGFRAPGVDARDDGLALTESDAVPVLREVGIERFIFGTDGPSVRPEPYLHQVLRLDLTDDERALILEGNARRIYAV